MAYCGVLSSEIHVRFVVSEEHMAFIITVRRFGDVGATLAVTGGNVLHARMFKDTRSLQVRGLFLHVQP
jgi:hypothetical protein